MFKSFKIAAVAFAAVASLGSMSHAAQVLYNGETVDGWTITTSPGVQIVMDSETPSTLVLEKFVDFTSNAGAIVTFTQAPSASSPAATTIDLGETITNLTGTTWSAYQNIIINPLATIQPPVVAGPATIVGGVYDSATASSTLTYVGTTPDGGTLNFGQNGQANGLVIDTNPSTGLPGEVRQSFMLKEVPTAAIPLPAAAWSGLSGLVGLALLGSAKKVKKILA